MGSSSVLPYKRTFRINYSIEKTNIEKEIFI